MYNRRTFLQVAGAASLGSVAFTNLACQPAEQAAELKRLSNISLQLYSIPHLLEADFAGTLDEIAAIGYSDVQFSGPFDFESDEVKASWKAVLGDRLNVSRAGYYGQSPAEIKMMLDDVGLTSRSIHVNGVTMMERLDAILEACALVGHEYIVDPFFMSDTIDGYKEAAERFNKIGEKCKEAGVKFGYHNHSFEFGEIDGQIPMDVLIEETDPELVDIELDLFWATVGGVDPVEYFTRYPGRFSMCHIKDLAEPMTDNANGTFSDPAAITRIFQNMTDVGNGIIDFGRIFAHAKTAGLELYIVERDPFAPDMANMQRQTMRTSYDHLANLTF